MAEKSEKQRTPADLNRRRMATLERRRKFLATRIKNYDGQNPSHDQAEKGALDWAIRICQEWIDAHPGQ